MVVLKRDDPLFWQKIRFKFIPSSVFVCPTDTVYGISTRIENKDGIKRILGLKNRDNSKFIFLVSSIEEVLKIAKLSTVQEIIVKRYWPGPISFILQSRKCEKDTVCLRMPKDDFLIALINFCGSPIISTSCNKSNEEPVSTIEDAMYLLGSGVDFYIDGGKILNKVSSTVVDLTLNVPKVLREGMVKFP